MAIASVLTALSNPSTHAAALSLIQIASSTLRIVESLTDPEMSDEEKSKAWQKVKEDMAAADAHLDSAIRSHPAWDSGP